MKAIAAALIMLALAAPATAGPLPRYGMFLFSSLCADPEGGDVEGARLVVVRTPHLDEIIFDYGNGGLFGTQVTSRTIRGAKLTAKLMSDEGGTGLLEAILSADQALAHLHFDGAAFSEDYHLARVTDFGKPTPTCRRR